MLYYRRGGMPDVMLAISGATTRAISSRWSAEGARCMSMRTAWRRL